MVLNENDDKTRREKEIQRLGEIPYIDPATDYKSEYQGIYTRRLIVINENQPIYRTLCFKNKLSSEEEKKLNETNPSESQMKNRTGIMKLYIHDLRKLYKHRFPNLPFPRLKKDFIDRFRESGAILDAELSPEEILILST